MWHNLFIIFIVILILSVGDVIERIFWKDVKPNGCDDAFMSELSYKRGYEDGQEDAVKHGHWIVENDVFCEWILARCSARCSYCDATYSFVDEVAFKDLNYDYCPNCGAKMDEEVD